MAAKYICVPAESLINSQAGVKVHRPGRETAYECKQCNISLCVDKYFALYHTRNDFITQYWIIKSVNINHVTLRSVWYNTVFWWAVCQHEFSRKLNTFWDVFFNYLFAVSVFTYFIFIYLNCMFEYFVDLSII